jgi:hypothetical protein
MALLIPDNAPCFEVGCVSMVHGSPCSYFYPMHFFVFCSAGVQTDSNYASSEESSKQSFLASTSAGSWKSLACLFLNYYYSFIHMCIHCLGHFSLLPRLPPSGRTCSALFSSSVEE